MSDVDDQIASARAAMARIAGDVGHRPGAGVPRNRQRRVEAVGKRLTRIAIADAALLVLALVVGLVFPIGLFGFLLLVILMALVTVGLAVWPAERAPTAERLVQSDLKALPAQTERWLAAQRAALPAPAAQLTDRIGLRLDALAPQLARVPADAPEAAELRKLVATDLPAFVADYQRVPPHLRAQPRNGRTPDAELVDGLKLIEGEIGEMTQRLAATDLDQLQTRGRYLEMKYGDEQG